MKTAEDYDVENEKAAKEFFADKDTVSISMLQRHLQWGYNRAARTIQQLLASGWIEEVPETYTYRKSNA